MKTPLLIDVPKSAPSARERFKAFIKQQEIVTHYCKGMDRKDCPWLACHMPSVGRMGYGMTEKTDLFDVVAKVGRLAEEAGILTEGETERQAVQRLCDNLKIPCP